MITVMILEAEDFVHPEDWCRPLELCTMSGGMSDSMSFRSCYVGSPENHVEWVKVKAVFGENWYGSKVKEFTEMLYLYEFLRGNPPRSHQLDMKGYTDLSKYRSEI